MNKLIKMVTMVVGVAAMLGVAGCGSDSPDSVAKDVVACLKSADFEGIAKYSTGDFKKGMGMLKGMMESSDKKEIEKYKKEMAKTKFELGAAVIDGDKANVPLKIDGKSTPIKLVKVDGKWMVEEFNFKDM